MESENYRMACVGRNLKDHLDLSFLWICIPEQPVRLS